MKWLVYACYYYIDKFDKFLKKHPVGSLLTVLAIVVIATIIIVCQNV